MIGQILLAENEAIYSAFAFAVLCVSVAAYSVVRERHKKQQTQIEAEFKREMVQKGLSAEEIERILKADAPLRE